MQVRCNIYGLTNASSGVECSIDRDLLEVGEYFHYNDQDYIIASVVEKQGRWFANVVPENRHRFRHRPFPAPRLPEEERGRETEQAWRERVMRAEHRVQELEDERAHVGERLDHLMHMLELLTKESDSPKP